MVQDKDLWVQPEPVCVFSTFCQYRATVWLLQLKLPFKIPQKSERGLASQMSFRQKTKGNANKAQECVFTHSESQKCSKMFKKCPKCPVGGLDSHSSPGCTHKSLSQTIFDLTIGFPTLILVQRQVESRLAHIL